MEWNQKGLNVESSKISGVEMQLSELKYGNHMAGLNKGSDKAIFSNVTT